MAGDFSTPQECEAARRELYQRGKGEPVAESPGLKPLADAEMNAKCVKPDDPRARNVIPWIGLIEPPLLDVDYLKYPDQKSRDYVASAGLAANISPARGTVITFPDSTNATVSPSGRYQLTNVDHPEDTDKDGDWHSVFLTDRKTGHKELFFKYARGIDVVWSPAPDAIVVNDYYGSNVSRSLLFWLPSHGEPIDIGERLSKSTRPPREKESIETADHIYPRVLKWLDDKRVVLEITGYNGVDPGGFTLVYVYDSNANSFGLLEYLHGKSD